jgi:hypothetical protein
MSHNFTVPFGTPAVVSNIPIWANENMTFNAKTGIIDGQKV